MIVRWGPGYRIALLVCEVRVGFRVSFAFIEKVQKAKTFLSLVPQYYSHSFTLSRAPAILTLIQSVTCPSDTRPHSLNHSLNHSITYSHKRAHAIAH